ncbi:MAG: LytTR family DNA-binding domain-containing protein [Cytophagales bacterium]|nr:LytTR family DNA-binding domain-containing protein [Cytophagales bacterium]
MIPSLLREPFILPEHIYSTIKRKLLIGSLFVVVFAVSDPFRLHLGGIIMLLLGISFLMIAIVLQLGLDRLNLVLSKKINWTVAHEIVKTLFYLLLLGSTVAFIFHLLGWIKLNLEAWLKFQFFTLLYGVIPVAISILHRQNKRLLELLQASQPNDQAIELLGSDKQKYSGTLDEIRYLKADENYVIIVEKDQRFHVRMTMKNAQEQLSKGGFLRVHRSYLVNSAAIKSIRSRHLMLTDDEQIPISRSFRSEYVRGLHHIKPS